MQNNYEWKYPEAIVECNWVKNRIWSNKVRVYDCTTYLHYTDDHPLQPYDVESGLLEYRKAHIPNAACLDLQLDLPDTATPYYFTLPDFKKLEDSFKKLGIGDPYHIVLYSKNGMQWSTRIWWMLYALGFKNVSILNGGFVEWKRLNLPIEKKVTRFDPAEFKSQFKEDIFVGKNRVLDAIADKSSLLLNALTADLHSGRSARYGRRGRIPNSINVPFHELINTNTQKLRLPQEVAKIFAKKSIGPYLKIVNYCGGGIAATLDAFVLYQIGFKKLQIYDNSMSEWAMDFSLPIEI